MPYKIAESIAVIDKEAWCETIVIVEARRSLYVSLMARRQSLVSCDILLTSQLRSFCLSKLASKAFQSFEKVFEIGWSTKTVFLCAIANQQSSQTALMREVFLPEGLDRE
ncbi:hypothetical protein CEXT_183501 [Caerostris extrusa]|uniref:Uncharacterized protein n=1 Tax=Caerostris extrusa TaxID=172846 RepID=A0AAV4MAW8_CAEEX|nr:hypothetical protein CEXT_183501 [Caerostris extrusa]